MELTGEYPEEDSEDLTDEEIAKAIPTVGTGDIVNVLQDLKCEVCNEPFVGHSHELRRRKPNLYWRVVSRCPQDHMDHRLFQVDWLQGS